MDLLLKFITAISAVLGGLWVWTKYVIERGLIPPAEPELDLQDLGVKGDLRIIEITFRINNKGASALVTEKIRIRLKTLHTTDQPELYTDARKMGRLIFPHDTPGATGPVTLVPHKTFVQPGVRQPYSYVTAMPKNAEYIHVHAEFRYAQRPGTLQNLILQLSKSIGLVSHSLQGIDKPHTIQKAFRILPAA